ncbi:hypothetical protein D3C81_515680 [compost metagenome]
MLSIRDVWHLIAPPLILVPCFVVPGCFINRMKRGRPRKILGAIFLLFWFISLISAKIYVDYIEGGR